MQDARVPQGSTKACYLVARIPGEVPPLRRRIVKPFETRSLGEPYSFVLSKCDSFVGVRTFPISVVGNPSLALTWAMKSDRGGDRDAATQMVTTGRRLFGQICLRFVSSYPQVLPSANPAIK